MDQIVEDRDKLFNAVFNHLGEVEQQPTTTPLDEELLRRAERNIDSHVSQDLLWRLLRTGEHVLESLQQDARPLTRVLSGIILHIPFDDLKQSISVEKLEAGLQSPAISIQLLILAYLQKAADLPSGASFVACNPSLTKVFLTTWLSVISTEVADKALDVLVLLLMVDSPNTSTFVVSGASSGQAQGQNLLWHRLFHDPEVYSLFYSWTALQHSNHDLKTKKGLQQATISQSRLFDFLARAAQIDWSHITTSTVPDVEQLYQRSSTGQQPYGGLLRYAASDMIDRQDILMEALRQDFFVKLLGVAEDQNNRGVTPRLLQAIQSDANQEGQEAVAENGLHL